MSVHNTDMFMNYVKISNQKAANTVVKIWRDSVTMKIA